VYQILLKNKYRFQDVQTILEITQIIIISLY